MKYLKKIMTLALAFVMCLGMSITVFADGEGEGGETPTPPQAEPGEFSGGDFSPTPETTINATGLKEGDTVEVYQLVKWDSDTSDWALNGTCGVTLAELVNGITEAEATTIAKNVSTTSIDTLTADADGNVTYNCTDNPGLFYLKAVPGTNNKDTVYNPAFVSADYYEDGNTVNFSTVIGSSTVFKSSSVPFDKDVNSEDKYIDTKPGDIIPYKITTTIPSYGTTFTNPVFTISDILSAGLELQDTITVKYGNTTTTQTDENVTITPNEKSGFTIAFNPEYLTGLNGATPKVEITYSAKVTTEAANNVTYMDNRAKLTFSNSPSTTKDQDDITRHYTFSIDANMNGGNHGNEKTRELIKIGVDDKGQTITDFTSWVEGEEWTEYTPLGGATFTLTDANGKTWTTESTSEGYISFHGLDAGRYTLEETAAPAGYVRDTESHIVVITPTYETGTDILKSYTITVDGNEGSTYTISNMSDTAATVETTVTDGALTFPFVNVKGTELPSTGGIGTTLFYVFGGIMVLGAGILLVSRQRMTD